jgi:hypothetical protein
MYSRHQIATAISVTLALVGSGIPTVARAEAPDAQQEETSTPPAKRPDDDRSEGLATKAPPTFEHETGFAIDARLPLAFDFGSTLGTARQGAPVAVGYRGQRFALLLGPLFGRQTTTDLDCGPGCQTTQTRYGAQLRADVTAFRAASARLDAYVPFSVAVAGNTSSSQAPQPTFWTAQSGEASWSAATGVGARYWLTPHLAVFSELTLAYVDVPTVISSVNLETTRYRDISFGGAVGAAFVF